MALTKLFLAKDSRVETLLVIGFNPSHSNMQGIIINFCSFYNMEIEVYAPFKILSLFIRGLDAEIKSIALRNGKMAQGEGENGGGGSGFMNRNDDEDGRMDTMGDDDYDDYNDMDDIDDEDKLQIDLNIQADDDYNNEIEKKFIVSLKEIKTELLIFHSFQARKKEKVVLLILKLAQLALCLKCLNTTLIWRKLMKLLKKT